MRWALAVAGAVVAGSGMLWLVLGALWVANSSERYEKQAILEAERLRERLAPHRAVNLTPAMTFAEIRTALRSPDTRAKLDAFARPDPPAGPLSGLAEAFVVKNQGVATPLEGTVTLHFYWPACGAKALTDAGPETCASARLVELSARTPFPGSLFGVRITDGDTQALGKLRANHPKVTTLAPGCWAIFQSLSDDEPSFVLLSRPDGVTVYDNRYVVSTIAINFATASTTRFC